ncbi:hypothetical protein RHGRI_024870 [Rhododendron griersonianum]|uniref:Uncharacterized protein n=1 Tax=Rhododendron griersonianum TaxID=479676 RepID=A0AAV6J8U9_9ERIC|nr:hypothetical protein RHGRI_024870 [Rhododendron griersonianum]
MTGVHQNQGWPRPHANFSLLSANLVLPFSPHPHCLSPSNLNPRRSRCSTASPRSPPPPESELPPTEEIRLRTMKICFREKVLLLVKLRECLVQKQLLLGCKIQCRSSLPFYSGCPCSLGLQHGMEGMMIDQTRDLNLEDDLVRILL